MMAMEKVDLQVTKAFRNKLICDYCKVFPRPGVKLMRCISCHSFLCDRDDCCGDFTYIRDRDECPICKFSNDNPKLSTFIMQNELMEFLAGFKTHPCINVKNGCYEDIPNDLEDHDQSCDCDLEDHDQSCIYQMVPCPKMDCEETVIFKNLDDHLKQTHINNVISIFCGDEKNEFAYKPEIYGIYKRQFFYLVNDRNYFEKDNCGIWFSNRGYWTIGRSKTKGGNAGYAAVKKDIPFPDDTTNLSWQMLISKKCWVQANKSLGVKVLSVSSQEWKFEGTKEELLASFCCLNVYGRQFYPQFNEIGDNCLHFRTLMLGFQDETTPFQMSVTFFNENDKLLLQIGGIVNPITAGLCKRFETSTNVNLKKLYREFKNQSTKIIFTMKIVDERANRLRFDSGLCRICMNAEICYVFDSCGHMVSCEKCALNERLKNCPICRKPIRKRIKTYRS